MEGSESGAQFIASIVSLWSLHRGLHPGRTRLRWLLPCSGPVGFGASRKWTVSSGVWQANRFDAAPAPFAPFSHLTPLHARAPVRAGRIMRARGAVFLRARSHRGHRLSKEPYSATLLRTAAPGDAARISASRRFDERFIRMSRSWRKHPKAGPTISDGTRALVRRSRGRHAIPRTVPIPLADAGGEVYRIGHAAGLAGANRGRALGGRSASRKARTRHAEGGEADGGKSVTEAERFGLWPLEKMELGRIPVRTPRNPSPPRPEMASSRAREARFFFGPGPTWVRGGFEQGSVARVGRVFGSSSAGSEVNTPMSR